MMSPWLQASQTASGPADSEIRASHSRTADTARDCAPASASPSSPGNTAADGWACTTFHSGCLARSLSGLPVQSPYRTSASLGSSDDLRERPGSTAAAVSTQRSSGLVTTAASGTGASRAATASACARPRSSRYTPGVWPASTGPVIAVSPCRTSRTVATGTL
jgi:hypothetical protein